MIEFQRKRWDDEASAFMKRQGMYHRAHGTHYFCGKVDGQIFWMFSTPRRTKEGWAEVNAFSDWKALFSANLDKKQRRAVRLLLTYLVLHWVFEELDNEGIYARFMLSNRDCLQLQKIVGHKYSLTETDQKSQTGEPFYLWQCSREDYRNSDTYQKAKEAVYDL